METWDTNKLSDSNRRVLPTHWVGEPLQNAVPTSCTVDTCLKRLGLL